MKRIILARPLSALVFLAVMTAPLRVLAAPPVSPEQVTPPPPAASPPPSDVPPPAPTPPRPSRATTPPHLAPYVAGAIAVVAAGVGTAFGVLALDAKSNFQKNPTQSEADSGNDYAAYSDAAFGAAVIAGVTSIVFFFAEKDAPSSAVTLQAAAPKESGVTLTASPFVSAHGAGAGAVVHF